MGCKETIIAATCLAVFSSTPAAPLPSHPIDMAKVFAGCAGRLAAQAQYSGTLPGDEIYAGSEAEAQSEHFTSLLDAVEPDAVALGLPAGTARSWQISAKAAQHVLLRMAEDGNPSAAFRAAHSARVHLATCSQLLL